MALTFALMRGDPARARAGVGGVRVDEVGARLLDEPCVVLAGLGDDRRGDRRRDRVEACERRGRRQAVGALGGRCR